MDAAARGARRSLLRATRSFIRHPGLTQALDKPVKGCTNVRIGGGRWCERFREHRDILDFRQSSATLLRVTGLRLMAGQCKRRGEDEERSVKIRIDCDRPAGPFDRLIVLLQPEIGETFAEIPK